MSDLYPLKKSPDPFDFNVIDIESRNWVRFIVLGFYNGNDYLEFRTLTKFFKFLQCTDLKSNKFFAHFGGKFDFLFLIRAIIKDKNWFIDEIIPRGSSMLSMRLIHKTLHKEFYFYDSSALLSFSLKDLTNNFDVETKKGEYDHSLNRPYNKELSEYLRSDCIGLYQVLKKFSEWPLIKKSGMATTIASQALRVFRTYQEKILFMPSEYHNDFSRQSYYGGRVEIFKPLCEKTIYEYDVNSLYPFIMLSHIYPVSCGIISRTYKSDRLGIYECEVVSPKNLYVPCLGILSKNKYIFPLGSFRGVFTSAEIEYARSLGYKIKVLKGIYFKDSKNIFKEYVTDIYDIRLKSKPGSIDNIIAKLLLNSLYGRFGMNPEKENITFDLKKGVTPYIEIKQGNRQQEIYKEATMLDSYINVAIASFVTSYARIHMHKLYMKCEKNLYYTDTDSIFTTQKMETSNELGALKLSGAYDSACFLLPKTYYLKSKSKSKIAMKGFDSKKIKSFTIDDFKNMLEGHIKTIKIKNEPKFATLKQALKKKKILTMTDEGTKQINAKYDKRIITKTKNQWDTRPIILGDNNGDN